MNRRQDKVVQMLIANLKRDVYEGSDPTGKRGSGEFWVTHSSSETYEPLNWDEIRDLEKTEYLERKWPDFDGYFKPGPVLTFSPYAKDTQ